METVAVSGEQFRCDLAKELGEGRAAQPCVGRGECVTNAVHWPPFCTNPRTKLSALVSRTSSISSSKASTSLSWAWAAPPVGAGAGVSSSGGSDGRFCSYWRATVTSLHPARSEEHTSELQSRGHLVCRLLLEK